MHNSQPQHWASESVFREFRCLHKGAKLREGETTAGAAEIKAHGAEALDKAGAVRMEGT